VARYRGEKADLHGVVLAHAFLAGANLELANLRKADLHAADLHGAYLAGADLTGADLTGADLRGASIEVIRLLTLDQTMILHDPRERPRPLVALFTGARYDDRTRWPQGFDPRHHGAARVARDRRDLSSAD
jgi:hypothetical protein